jgi:hypothetical protein
MTGSNKSEFETETIKPCCPKFWSDKANIRQTIFLLKFDEKRSSSFVFFQAKVQQMRIDDEAKIETIRSYFTNGFKLRV